MSNTGMLVSMKPTSVDHSGTSASVNNNGGVDFSAVTSLSLNGVFTSDYDNYLMVINAIKDVTGNVTLGTRLSVGGVEDSTANSYIMQSLIVSGTSYTNGNRTTENTWNTRSPVIANAGWNGLTYHIYGPYLTQPTAIRAVTGIATSGAYIADAAGTHNQSTSYDGLSFTIASSITGSVHVFGYRE